MKLRYTAMLLATLMFASGIAEAGERGTTVKVDTLKESPFSDAKIISSLPATSTVEILKKQGGRYQVKTQQGSGWIRMLSVRREASMQKDNQLAGIASLASGRSGTGKIVSTTGIRGLNEEELKAAQFDEKQVSRLESYMTSRTDAQKFANQAKLHAQQIDYLTDPASGASK